MQHKNGTWRWFLTRDTVLRRSVDGRPQQVLGMAVDITARKYAEEVLRASEAFTRTLLNSSPDCVKVLDHNGQLLQMNSAGLCLMEIDNIEPLIGQPWETLWPPACRTMIRKALRAARKGEQGRFQGLCPTAKGKLKWWDVIVVAVQAEQAVPAHFISVSRDITEMKRTEEQLHLNERHLKLALEAGNTGVWAWNLRTKALTWSPELYGLLGLATKSVINSLETFLALVHVDDRLRMEKCFTRVATGEATVAADCRIRCNDGSERWISVKGEVIEYAHGQPVRMVGVITDITGRKTSERQLQFHASLLDYAYDAVVATDLDLNITAWNRGAEAMYGWRAAEVLGRKAHEVMRSTLTADQRTAALQQMATTDYYQVEVTTYHRDGTSLLVEGYTVAMRDEQGQIRGYMSINRDIGARKRAEEALRLREAQLNTILYNMPAAVYMISADHHYLFVNRIYEQENKVTNREIQGQSVYDRWPAEVAKAMVANEQQVLRNKAPLEIEEVVARGNKIHYYATIKAPLLNEANEPYAIIGISTEITERKQAEAALRRSEERYRTLFETMDEGFCVFEMLFDVENKPVDYRFLEVNPAFARLTGLEEAMGKTARQLVPNLEAHWVDMYGRVALTGEPQRFVEGSAAMGRWFEVYAFRFGAAENHQVALLFSDITTRKQVEEQARQQEELLRLVTDNVPGLIAYVSLDETYRFVNATFETWFQRPRHQIIGKTIRALIGDAEWTRLRPYRQQALAGQDVSYETHFTYPDGVTRVVWGRYRPHFAADGTVQGFYLFMLDISERKQAEDQLRSSEARFRQLAEAMPQVVWACDKDGALTYINSQWPSYSGMDLTQTMTAGMWPALHPDDLSGNCAAWQHAVANGQPYEAELRLRRADGIYRWHLERAIPIRNEAGVITQWFGATVDINDYKSIQEALLRANERFALAEQASNGWVYDFDVQQRKAERSAGFSRVLGYTPEEIKQDTAWWYSLFHPDDRYLTEGRTSNRSENAEFTEAEYRIRHRNGHYVYLLDRSRTIYDALGQRMRMVGITVDISERKRRELHQQFLSQLGMQLRLLSDIDAIMTHLVRSIGNHLGVSGCRVNEIQLAQAQFTIQKDWAATGHPASGVYPLAELAPASLLAALQSGQTVVVMNMATDPRTEPLADHYRATQTAAFIGVPIFRQGQWSATLSVREHSERPWHPDEVALLETIATQFQPLLEKVRIEQALRHSEERLRLALASGGLGIWEWEPANNTYSCTEQLYKLFGLAAEEPLTYERAVDIIHPEDQSALLDLRAQMVTQQSEYTGEYRIIYPTGEIHWLAEHSVAIYDQQKDLVRILGVNFDITERKAAEQALQHFNEQLEQRVQQRTAQLERSNRELDQFAYVASHDLKAPLRGIEHLANWISEDAFAVLPESSREHLIKLRVRIKRMEQLLNDLLAYSRVGRRDGEPEAVNTESLVNDVIALLDVPANFAINLVGELPNLVTPKAPLEMIMRNLIGNAIKHHHEPRFGAVWISAQTLENFVEFCIRDNGPGIDAQYHERIFGVFQTLNPRDQMEGSGMGLALVKKAVEYRGGIVRVESTPGQGTAFYFTWPKVVRENTEPN